MAQFLTTPEQFDAVTEYAPRELVREAVWISSDAQWHVERLLEASEAGFEALYLHHVGQDQRPWLDFAGENILPIVKEHHGHR